MTKLEYVTILMVRSYDKANFDEFWLLTNFVVETCNCREMTKNWRFTEQNMMRNIALRLG